MELNFSNEEIEKVVELLAPRLVAAIMPMLRQQLSSQYQQDGTLLDVGELSQYLGVKPSWIYEKTHLKEIPFTKVGHFPRFRKKEIDKWLESRKFNPVR